MCFFPRMIKNPHYKVTKKNKGNVPWITDERVRYIPAECGQCLECREKKVKEWRVRLEEELRKNKEESGFITLTFDENNKCNNNDEIAEKLRLFWKRLKKAGCTNKHWMYSEKGEEGRLHLHGIIWGKDIKKLVKEKWNHGFVYVGDYVSGRSINYIVKYILKDNNGFQGKVFASNGIGSPNIKDKRFDNKKYREGLNNTDWVLKDGQKIAMPRYYKNKLYTDEEKEKIWINKLNKGYIYIGGVKVNINDEISIKKMLEYQQRRNKELTGITIDTQEEWYRKLQENRQRSRECSLENRGMEYDELLIKLEERRKINERDNNNNNNNNNNNSDYINYIDELGAISEWCPF